MKDTQTTRRRVLRRSAVAATTGGLALSSTSSADDGIPEGQGILADGFDWSTAPGGVLSGLVDRATSTQIGESPRTWAEDAVSEFGERSSDWIGYANWLISEQAVEPLGTATVGVDFVSGNLIADDDDRQPTTLKATFDDSIDEYTSVAWHLGEASDPDYVVDLNGIAADEAADELRTFRRRFIGDEYRLPTDEYLSYLGGKYGQAVKFGPDQTSAADLFFGR